ncbi:MAG: hypothetical protein C0436_05385, partial [Alphaproteobacteria bacterium]|nr:hypothetical protein [Alphaproteobacteria bacterium]
MNRNTPHAANSNMILGGGDTGTFVAGDRLKQVDTPVETLLGAANGAVSGAMVSTAVSAAVTLGKEGNQNLVQNIFRNVTGAHLLGVLGGTAAFAALGGIVRFSRARM